MKIDNLLKACKIRGIKLDKDAILEDIKEQKMEEVVSLLENALSSRSAQDILDILYKASCITSNSSIDLNTFICNLYIAITNSKIEYAYNSCPKKFIKDRILINDKHVRVISFYNGGKSNVYNVHIGDVKTLDGIHVDFDTIYSIMKEERIYVSFIDIIWSKDNNVFVLKDKEGHVDIAIDREGKFDFSIIENHYDVKVHRTPGKKDTYYIVMKYKRDTPYSDIYPNDFENLYVPIPITVFYLLEKDTRKLKKELSAEGFDTKFTIKEYLNDNVKDTYSIYYNCIYNIVNNNNNGRYVGEELYEVVNRIMDRGLIYPFIRNYIRTDNVWYLFPRFHEHDVRTAYLCYHFAVKYGTTPHECFISTDPSPSFDQIIKQLANTFYLLRDAVLCNEIDLFIDIVRRNTEVNTVKIDGSKINEVIIKSL